MKTAIWSFRQQAILFLLFLWYRWWGIPSLIKRPFCIQLLEALKKDGIKAAIFVQKKDFSNITNVDLILTCDLEDEDCFKIEAFEQ